MPGVGMGRRGSYKGVFYGDGTVKHLFFKHETTHVIKLHKATHTHAYIIGKI